MCETIVCPILLEETSDFVSLPCCFQRISTRAHWRLVIRLENGASNDIRCPFCRHFLVGGTITRAKAIDMIKTTKTDPTPRIRKLRMWCRQLPRHYKTEVVKKLTKRYKEDDTCIRLAGNTLFSIFLSILTLFSPISTVGKPHTRFSTCVVLV